jgi:PST family polysaccharide transporter
LAGAVLLAVLAVPISLYTFKSMGHSIPLLLLSTTILVTSLAGGQAALIQGVRRIGDLARMTVIGSIAGSVIGISLYYGYGLNGIAPALIIMSGFNLATAWWFARRIPAVRVEMSWRESFAQAGGLAKLGVALMWSGLVTTLVAYLTRALITRQIGLEAVGMFQAAFGLAGMFIEFVLKAMGADFYPRLTAASSDHQEMNQLVNEQTEIGILLAAPGLMVTIVIAPWVISIFYSAQFTQAVDLMRWFVFGCLGRVISWPMGFILLAKGESRLFLVTETLFGFLHMALIWTGLKLLGLSGIAMAFVLLYVFFTVFMLLLVGRLTGFHWTKGVWALSAILVPASVGILVCCLFLPVLPATFLGGLIAIAVSLYCLHQLAQRLGPDHRVCGVIRRIPFARQMIAT